MVQAGIMGENRAYSRAKELGRTLIRRHGGSRAFVKDLDENWGVELGLLVVSGMWSLSGKWRWIEEEFDAQWVIWG